MKWEISALSYILVLLGNIFAENNVMNPPFTIKIGNSPGELEFSRDYRRDGR